MEKQAVSDCGQVEVHPARLGVARRTTSQQLGSKFQVQWTWNCGQSYLQELFWEQHAVDNLSTKGQIRRI